MPDLEDFAGIMAIDLTGAKGAWPRKAKLEIKSDIDTESPLENDGSWTLYDFHPRHARDNPKDAGYVQGKNGWEPTIGLMRKLKVGLAFILDAYEHSGRIWSLAGGGMQDQWDTSHGIGILVWKNKPSDMGAKTVEERRKDAKACLDEYNKWLAGDCYGYILTDADTEEEIDSCWGFIGLEHVQEAVKDALGDRTLVDEEGEPIEIKDVEPTYPRY